MVGNYLALVSRFLKCVPKAQEVVQWMNSHSRALGIFRREQFQTFQKFLMLIRPVITWWTAHYLSLCQLLEVQIPLQTCWLKYGAEIILSAGPRPEAKEKAESVRKTIESLIFWSEVKM